MQKKQLLIHNIIIKQQILAVNRVLTGNIITSETVR